LPHPHQHLLLLPLNMAILTGVRGNPSVVLICISLIARKLKIQKVNIFTKQAWSYANLYVEQTLITLEYGHSNWVHLSQKQKCNISIVLTFKKIPGSYLLLVHPFLFADVRHKNSGSKAWSPTFRLQLVHFPRCDPRMLLSLPSYHLCICELETVKMLISCKCWED
jgi:hypothetical protein